MAGASGKARLQTGIEALDRQLDGGLPAGSVLAYCAPPASQSEVLLYQVTAARDTLYLTTDRSEDAVRDAFDRARCPTGEPQIKQVPSDAPLDNARQLLMAINGQANLIIDPTDVLEREDRNRYQRFVNELQNHMINTGSIAILHCLRSDDEPAHRTVTEHMADVIFDLDIVSNGADLETRLAIPKFRGGRALDETIKLELAERVRVDTSRDIA